MSDDRPANLLRRSSGRCRKSPDRFVAEASGSKAAGDFAAPTPASKKAKRQRPALESLSTPPESLVGQRVSIYWPNCKQWFGATVSNYNAKSETDAFRVDYDDGETEKGVFGSRIFRTRRKDYEYKPRDVDEDRPGAASGATEQSQRTAERDSDGTSSSASASDSPAETASPERRPGSSAAATSTQLPKDLPAGSRALAGAGPGIPGVAATGSGTNLKIPGTADSPGQHKSSTGLNKSRQQGTVEEGHSPKIIADAALAAGGTVREQPGTATLGLTSHGSGPKSEGRRKRSLDVNAAARPPQQSRATSTVLSAADLTPSEGDGMPTAPTVFREFEIPGLTETLPPASTAQFEAPRSTAVGAREPKRSAEEIDQPATAAQRSTGDKEMASNLTALPAVSQPSASPKTPAAEPLDEGERPSRHKLDGTPSARVSQRQQQASKKPIGGAQPAAAAANQLGLPPTTGSASGRPNGSPASAASPAAQARKTPDTPEVDAGQNKRQKVTDDAPASSRPDVLAKGGPVSKPRTTSIAGPRFSAILPSPAAAAVEAPVERPQSPEEPEYEPAPDVAEGSGPDGVPDEQVRADVICSQMEGLLAGLTRARDSIGRATSTALSAAQAHAAPRVIRLVVDALERVDTPAKRIDILYLVDSILQGCMRDGKPECGPGSPAAEVFPRVIAAALPRLVDAVIVSSEGVEKAGKVLNIWQKRKLVSSSLLQPQLLKLDVAREALKAQPAPPQQAAATPVRASRGPPGAGKDVKLDFASGMGAVSAVLENQYGTHKGGQGGLLRAKSESSESDSDDEPDEHELELRAQTNAALQRDGAVLPAGTADFDSNAGYEAPSSAAGSQGKAVPWAAGTDSGLRSTAFPPGFSPQSFQPITISLRKPQNSRGYGAAPALAGQGLQDRNAIGRPASYHAPPMAAFGSGFGEDDRLDAAGAGDRTFEEAPPLPPDEWDAPPLPPEEAPPLPEDDSADGPPPLPTEPPPLMGGQNHMRQLEPFEGNVDMDWEGRSSAGPALGFHRPVFSTARPLYQAPHRAHQQRPYYPYQGLGQR